MDYIEQYKEFDVTEDDIQEWINKGYIPDPDKVDEVEYFVDQAHHEHEKK